MEDVAARRPRRMRNSEEHVYTSYDVLLLTKYYTDEIRRSSEDTTSIFIMLLF